MDADLAQNLPSEDEDRDGDAKGATVCTKEEMEFARRALRIRVAGAMLEARTYAHRRGMTDEMMAGRIRWSVKKWRRTCLDYENLTLDRVSDFMCSTGCELSLQAVGIDRTVYTPSGVAAQEQS